MRYLVAVLLMSIVLLSAIPMVHAEAPGKYSAKIQSAAWQSKVNKQVQIVADVTNNQDRTQPFAYIVQIQTQDGVVISLSWITGSLDAGQSLNPAQSWTPTIQGNYTAQIFVWTGINNPDALSPPLSMKIMVA